MNCDICGIRCNYELFEGHATEKEKKYCARCHINTVPYLCLCSSKGCWRATQILHKMEQKRYTNECMDILLEFDQRVQKNGDDYVYNLDGSNKIGERIHDLLGQLDIESRLYVSHHDCTFVLSKESLDKLSTLSYILLDHDENLDKVIELYKKVIRLGNKDAMYNLAELYQDEGKYSEATKLYNQAIELGHVLSIFSLAYMYETGKHPDGKDIKKAIELYKKGASLKCNDCMESLSRLFCKSLL